MSRKTHFRAPEGFTADGLSRALCGFIGEGHTSDATHATCASCKRLLAGEVRRDLGGLKSPRRTVHWQPTARDALQTVEAPPACRQARFSGANLSRDPECVTCKTCRGLVESFQERGLLFSDGALDFDRAWPEYEKRKAGET